MNLGPTLVLLLGLGTAQLPPPTESPAPLAALSPPAPAAGTPRPGDAPRRGRRSPRRGRPSCSAADYLHWWSKTLSTPPLITTSNAADAGVIGAPSTQVLAGGNGVELDGLQGFRIQGRYWCSELWGIDAGGFYLANGGRYNTYTRQTLAIPFVNPATGAQTSLVLANIPNGPYGYAAIQAMSALWSVEAHGVLRVADDPEQPFELLLGGRYVTLGEDLRLWTYTQTGAPSSSGGSLPGVPTTSSSGTAFSGLDQFETRNHFIGGQAGARYRYRWGRCSVETAFTVAAGVTRQELNVNGNTILNGTARSYLGDVFTQTSNLGRFTRDTFTVLPQARVAVGFQVFELVRVFVGGDVLYWSGVVRPADQIDTLVYPSAVPAATNLNPVPGGQPLPRYGSSDYWAVGLSLGAEIAF
ncbi:MAG: BBP7 family outer membrane beta-barrel protein [Gemmataceae bacterium]